MDKDFHFTKTDNPKCPVSNEYLWQPLTPGAYPNGYKSNIKNEAPSAPAHVTATSVPEGLLLKWDDATDDHTPWMQMRYNVSLKIKGKTGENAFVLSPMNGLSDEAAICSGLYYRKATQLIVPKTALVNGTTYELQVQAIDLMGEHSAMTKPVEVTYNAEKMIMIDYIMSIIQDWLIMASVPMSQVTTSLSTQEKMAPSYNIATEVSSASSGRPLV